MAKKTSSKYKTMSKSVITGATGHTCPFSTITVNILSLQQVSQFDSWCLNF